MEKVGDPIVSVDLADPTAMRMPAGAGSFVEPLDNPPSSIPDIYPSRRNVLSKLTVVKIQAPVASAEDDDVVELDDGCDDPESSSSPEQSRRCRETLQNRPCHCDQDMSSIHESILTECDNLGLPGSADGVVLANSVTPTESLESSKKTRSSRTMFDTFPGHSEPSIGQETLSDEGSGHDHLPKSLPRFRDPQTSMWSSSYAANSPSEDRSSSLVNVLLRPIHRANSMDGQLGKDSDEHVLIRLSLWSVIDGHGGGVVATYASEVLLPHIAASVSSALECVIVDCGTCTVNGQLCDANALDLDGLIRTTNRSRANPNSIRYRSPREMTDAEGGAENDGNRFAAVSEDASTNLTEEKDSSGPSIELEGSLASSGLPRTDTARSVKSSAKPADSLAGIQRGTHSPNEIAKITRAITESFLAVDEGWINSIDPISTHQNSCQSNGRWNSGACALVVVTVQRLDWTSNPIKDPDSDCGGPDARWSEVTSLNRCAARSTKSDYESKEKGAISFSTLSSVSSLVTDIDPASESVPESEITEDDDDNSPKSSRKQPLCHEATKISTPGGCQCHFYQSNDAMLYTAHVGDCRAVMLGTAPPQTVKVLPDQDVGFGHADNSDDGDDSTYHSSDETECLSSSEQDAGSSDDEEVTAVRKSMCDTTPSYMTYMRRPVRRQCCRYSPDEAETLVPFVALPRLNNETSYRAERSDVEPEYFPVSEHDGKAGDRTIGSTSLDALRTIGETPRISYLLRLSPDMRPIDLTTDHSAYNPAEVTAVLRRCKNAPNAISTGVAGGIRRVGGSLAVTRALGDAYLKAPLLSFFPYKRHAPYITAQPEVNYRLLTKDEDKVLILATDGVWERASGEDILRWLRNYDGERIAVSERQGRRRRAADRLSRDTVPSGGVLIEDHKVSGEKKIDSLSAFSKKRKWPSTNGRVAAAHRRRTTVTSTPAEMIVRRVLNKVRRVRSMSSLNALMSLPKGRARRSKHDDITAIVVKVSGFVS